MLVNHFLAYHDPVRSTRAASIPPPEPQNLAGFHFWMRRFFSEGKRLNKNENAWSSWHENYFPPPFSFFVYQVLFAVLLLRFACFAKATVLPYFENKEQANVRINRGVYCKRRRRGATPCPLTTLSCATWNIFSRVIQTDKQKIIINHSLRNYFSGVRNLNKETSNTFHNIPQNPIPSFRLTRDALSLPFRPENTRNQML